MTGFVHHMKERAAFCGIDVGLKSHAICLLDESQNELTKYVIPNDIHGFRKLEADLDKHTKICLEPTGIYSINIFLHFRNRGCDIRFCKTESSHNFRQSMFSRRKHDRFDALALAKYRIVNDHQTFDGSKIIEKLGADTRLYSPEYQALSDLVDQYQLTRKRVKVLQTWIKNLVDLRFPEAVQIFPSDRGSKSIRQALLHSKQDILSGKVKVNRLKAICDRLKDSIGQYEMKREDFGRYVNELDVLEARLRSLEAALRDRLEALGYSFLLQYRALKTVSAAVLVKEIRDIRRFYRYSKNGAFNKKKSLKAFKNFLGLTVTSNQSGMKEGSHVLARSGNLKLRQILFFMAMNYTQADPAKQADSRHSELNPSRFRTLYDALVARGVRKMVALTKVMNKIATDVFFVLKRNADGELLMNHT